MLVTSNCEEQPLCLVELSGGFQQPDRWDVVFQALDYFFSQEPASWRWLHHGRLQYLDGLYPFEANLVCRLDIMTTSSAIDEFIGEQALEKMFGMEALNVGIHRLDDWEWC